MAALGPEVKFTPLAKCAKEGCDGSLKTRKTQGISTAHIWDGADWEEIRHGRKVCRKCGLVHRPHYVLLKKEKVSTITEELFKKADTFIMVTSDIGFTIPYLRQLELRQFRSNVSLLSEASVVLQARDPPAAVRNDEVIGSSALAAGTRRDRRSRSSPGRREVRSAANTPLT